LALPANQFGGAKRGKGWFGGQSFSAKSSLRLSIFNIWNNIFNNLFIINLAITGIEGITAYRNK